MTEQFTGKAPVSKTSVCEHSGTRIHQEQADGTCAFCHHPLIRDLSEQYAEAVIAAHNANQRTPQQAEIAEKADELLQALDRLVPRTTIHYAIEEMRLNLTALIRIAHTIKTEDKA